jgi:hypothetical protein
LSITKPKIERVDKEEYMLLGEKVLIPMREKKMDLFHKWSNSRGYAAEYITFRLILSLYLKS